MYAIYSEKKIAHLWYIYVGNIYVYLHAVLSELS
jgi:hypothetical protein